MGAQTKGIDMSRELLVSLCAITSLGLAACGGGSDDDDGNNNSPDAGSTVQYDAAVSNDPDAAVDTPDAGDDPCDLCVAEATCEVDVCTCPDGQVGDGTTAGTGCSPAGNNECEDGTHNCTLQCVDTPEGFTCNDQILATHMATASYDILSLSYDPDPAIDDTVTIENTVTMTGSLGEIITGTTGAATDPTTGIVYVVVKDDGALRHLATLDVATGVATFVGQFPQNVASIAFNDAGELFGITGQGADPSSEFSSIDKADATTTPILALTNGDSADGETLVSRPGDPLMYRWSGNDPYDFQSVDSLGVLVDLAQPTLDTEGEKTAAVFSNVLDAFLLTDRDVSLHVYRLDQTADTIAGISSEKGGYHKGLVFVPAPPPAP